MNMAPRTLIAAAFACGAILGAATVDLGALAQAHERQMPQAFLILDGEPPAPGAALQADARHIPFADGQRQVSVDLAPGRHQLQLAFSDRDGSMPRRFRPGGAISIVVE